LDGDRPADSSSGEDPAVVEAQRRLEAMSHGIDISGHSGEVDWSAVMGQGATFVFLKATEGVDLVDPAFAEHWQALRGEEVVRGAYHFYVTEDDPKDQAKLFIETVDLQPGDFAPVVDIELIGHGTLPGLADRLQACLEILENHYGVRPILYTSSKFWDTHLTDEFGDYPLWVAEYEVDEPVLPKGWSDWTLWQWSGDATIEGVEKGADLNRVNPRHSDRSALVVPHKF